MSNTGRRVRRWLTGAVLAHLVISFVHGAAHSQAHVPMSRAANLFVAIVILAGPLVGLGLLWVAQQVGSWLVATTMAGSLVFGVLNHFLLQSGDHVAQIDPDWQILFAVTALLLAVTEAIGSSLAIRLLAENAAERIDVSSMKA
jgi:hypothetical protein